MDKEYEALLENYEDAMMRLVMYRVAQEDGRKLLEEAEQLEADGFEVPKELDEKCLKLIRDAAAGRQPKQFLNKTSANTGRTRSHPRPPAGKYSVSHSSADRSSAPPLSAVSPR